MTRKVRVVVTFEALLRTPLTGGLYAQESIHKRGGQRGKKGGRDVRVSDESDYETFDRRASLIGEEGKKWSGNSYLSEADRGFWR